MSFPNSYQTTVDRTDKYKNGEFFQIPKDIDKVFLDLDNPTAIRLYFYYLKNTNGWVVSDDGYENTKRALNDQLGDSTFRKARKILVDKGYLVDEGKHKYTFHEVPVKQNATNVAEKASNKDGEENATIIAKNENKVATNVASSKEKVATSIAETSNQDEKLQVITGVKVVGFDPEQNKRKS